MKRIAHKGHVDQLFVRDRARLHILLLVKPGMDFQAFFRSRVTDELDHDLECLQGDALPIASDVTEKAMFDLVPLACSRRKMAYLNLQARGVG